MFTGKELPRCSEGSLHPQSSWIQSGLRGQVVVLFGFCFFHDSYENFPFAPSCSKKMMSPSDQLPQVMLFQPRAVPSPPC